MSSLLSPLTSSSQVRYVLHVQHPDDCRLGSACKQSENVKYLWQKCALLSESSAKSLKSSLYDIRNYNKGIVKIIVRHTMFFGEKCAFKQISSCGFSSLLSCYCIFPTCSVDFLHFLRTNNFLTLIRMTKDEKVLAIFKGLML